MTFVAFCYLLKSKLFPAGNLQACMTSFLEIIFHRDRVKSTIVFSVVSACNACNFSFKCQITCPPSFCLQRQICIQDLFLKLHNLNNFSLQEKHHENDILARFLHAMARGKIGGLCHRVRSGGGGGFVFSLPLIIKINNF